jgi:hypothetical protein
MVWARTDDSSVHKYGMQTEHSSHQPLTMEIDIASEMSHTNSTVQSDRVNHPETNPQQILHKTNRTFSCKTQKTGIS